MLRSAALSVLLHTGVIALIFASVSASKKPPPQAGPASFAEPAPQEPAPEHFPPLVLTRMPSRYPQSQPLQHASQQPSLHTSQQASLQLQPPPPEGARGGTAW
jgi:hypothetical protein